MVYFMIADGRVAKTYGDPASKYMQPKLHVYCRLLLHWNYTLIVHCVGYTVCCRGTSEP